MITSLKIKELAKEKNLTLKKLAIEIGLSEAGFHKMLKTNKFKVEELKKISQLFNVPLTALMSLDDILPVDPKTIELKNEIIKLKNRIEELEEKLQDKKFIIEMLRDKEFHSNLADRNFRNNIEILGIYDHNILDENLSSIDKELSQILKENADVKELIKDFRPYFSEYLLKFIKDNRKNDA